jgi:hypothetical protein
MQQGRVVNEATEVGDERHLHPVLPSVRRAGIPRSARDQYRRLYRGMAVTDTLSISLALLIAYWIRFGVHIPRGDFLLLLLATPLFVVGMFAAFHLYEAHRFTPAEEFRRIILAV